VFGLPLKLPLPILTSILLAYRTADMNRRLEQQNDVLEDQVIERTRELQTTNEEISRQMDVQSEQAREIEIANSKLQELNALLKDQNIQLEELNIEKNEIMGIVAHDLKNPIGAVLGLAELLQEGVVEKPEQVQQVVGQISSTADRMLALVKNLLDVNQLESGGMQFELVRLDIAPVVESAVWQYQAQAAAKNIALHYFTGASPSVVFADERAMIQVLDNLISNAIKFSPSGKNIFVRMKASSEAVRVEIQDEGPGISPKDMTKLFGKFSRLDAQPTGGEHSTGLGLSIVKKLVEGMNGRVWCESVLGEGAMFIVELPTAG
jgi:signal transduction histidine kinase